MDNAVKLPIGIEDFEEIRTEGFYYVDKTGMITELLHNWGKVNLFTRPRRFGKSLNMSMLKYFFSYDGNPALFEGLAVSREKELCEKYMGQYPVISISLKGVLGRTYEIAGRMLNRLINEESYRIQSRMQWEKLPELHQKQMKQLLDDRMDEDTQMNALRTLSSVMHQYYGRKVIILIDEYDVPLAKAFANGYYDRMVLLIQTMFGQILKSNENLAFAVLTGCLRVAKESIFTGLNNLKVLSMQDIQFSEYFGFTDPEVRQLLEAYDLSDAYENIRDWYDGYQFGSTQIYCPWDVLNYCDLLLADRDAAPQDFWSNTSSNDVIRHLIENAGNGTTKQEIERLVAGKEVVKKIRKDLTYRDLFNSVENIWSVLFLTGYLTLQGRPDGDWYRLVIPNMEIRKIFTEQIMDYFCETVKRDGRSLKQFCDALKHADAGRVQEQLNRYLKKAVGIRDTFVRKPLKENYYHGILMGLLAYKDDWAVMSNRESGDGYSDILVEMEEDETGIVIEVKYAEHGDLKSTCQEALAQIEKNGYADQLLEDGMRKVLKYGVACYKKRCMVMLASESEPSMYR